MTAPFEIFLTGTPGLESLLADEATEKGFQDVTTIKGGVTFQGTWQDVWRANLELRGATRVLARVGSFMAFHLAQLDKRARKFPWGEVLRTDLPVKVEVTCKASKIYHAGAATQRIETALTDSHGMKVSKEAEIVIKTPDGPPGLVIVNPPYGARIGNKKLLYPLYGALGEALKTRFRGWRVGLVTSEPGLAKATGLPFGPQGPSIPHGGLKIWLLRSETLG